MGKREGIVRARRGAVLAEFAIAFMPICTMFLCVCEMSRYFIARMAVLHAAQVAVRACAVTLDPQPGNEAKLNGDPENDYKKAADQVLTVNMIYPRSGFVGGSSELKYTEPECKNAGGDSNGRDDSVQIDAKFTCNIPVASRIICGTGGTIGFSMYAKFPHQGADYEMDP